MDPPATRIRSRKYQRKPGGFNMFTGECGFARGSEWKKMSNKEKKEYTKKG